MVTKPKADKQPKTAKRKPGGRPFKPGQSGNPAGRPKTRTLSEYLRSKLEEVDPSDPDGRTFGEVYIEKIVIEAMANPLKSMAELFDRTEGKVPNRSEDTGKPLPAPPEPSSFRGVDMSRPEGESA